MLWKLRVLPKVGTRSNLSWCNMPMCVLCSTVKIWTSILPLLLQHKRLFACKIRSTFMGHYGSLFLLYYWKEKYSTIYGCLARLWGDSRPSNNVESLDNKIVVEASKLVFVKRYTNRVAHSLVGAICIRDQPLWLVIYFLLISYEMKRVLIA